MMIKGVRHNRDENDSNHDYVFVDTNENEGLRFYLHKYFIGFHPYYIVTKHEDHFKKNAETPLDKIPMNEVMAD